MEDADNTVQLLGGWYSYRRRADAYQALKQFDKARADYQIAEEENQHSKEDETQ